MLWNKMDFGKLVHTNLGLIRCQLELHFSLCCECGKVRSQEALGRLLAKESLRLTRIRGLYECKDGFDIAGHDVTAIEDMGFMIDLT